MLGVLELARDGQLSLAQIQRTARRLILEEVGQSDHYPQVYSRLRSLSAASAMGIVTLHY